MRILLHDLRYALRQLRKAPGFTFVCVLTLALGIGANTAIFTLVDAVMLKSLPVKNPKELYRLGDTFDCCVEGDMDLGSWSLFPYAFYKQLRDHTPEFEDLAAFQAFVSNFSVRRSGDSGPAQPHGGEFVSGNYFRTFGVSAFAGRMISSADDDANAAPVAVMSYRAWQQRFALDPSVLGSTFMINQVPFTVVGIAPPGFFGETLRSDPPDFWLPTASEPSIDRQNPLLTQHFSWLYVIGRLRPGLQPTRVQAEVTLELQQWLPSQPNFSAKTLSSQHIVLTPGGSGIGKMQSDYNIGLRFLATISGLVLLIACANLANLLLARGAAARSLTAIRVALGAQRRRLVRAVLTESVLLAVAGGVAGLVVALFGTRVILSLAFRGARFVPIHAAPSLPVLGFAFALSLLTGIVFGVAPAWITSRSDPAEALRGVGRTTRDHGFSQKWLVVLQISLSAVLLVGAGLVTKNLRNLQDQNFGFQTQGRLVVNVDPSLAGYKPEKLSGLYRQLRDHLPQIPGVLSASYSLYSPMSGNNWSEGIAIEGHPGNFSASWNRIGPRFFETIGTSLLRGRTIGEGDTPSSQQVAVVNETFARKFFPKEDAIGQHFGFDDQKHAGDFEIVGIVEDAKYQDARGPAYATFFVPFLQVTKDPKLAFMMASHYIGAIELHVSGKPENREAAVRRTLADIDPNLTVLDMMSMEEQVNRNFNQETLIARLTELFGSLALILACVGLYGVTAYSVARRTNEIGIRMALGADRQNVLRMVLRGSLIQVGIGLAIGIPAALAASRLIANQLYGVKTYDPLILGIAVLVLTACALLAGLIPARRAASIEPMEALRTE